MASQIRIYRFIACAALLSCSAASAAAGSGAWLVSIECDKFQRVGDTIRVSENTSMVDTDWDGYSLSAGQRIAHTSIVPRDKKLFRMIAEACKL